MHTTHSIGRAPNRRRIWRYVIIAVLLAAIVEPLVMYRMLAAQKEKRQAAAELVIPAMAHRAAPR